MSRPTRCIAIIPARIGSKGIPRKNIKDFCGKPLISWLVEALNASSIDEVIVSTDGKEIKDCVNAIALDKVRVFNRHPDTAKDEASSESVVLDYLERTQHDDDDIVILAQATSPWTQPEDINQAVDKVINNECDSLLSVVPNHAFLWNGKGESINYDYSNRPRRQDMADQYMENGAFYITRAGRFKTSQNRLGGKIGYYIMPAYSAIELDDEHDWLLAEAIMQQLKK